MLTEAELTSFIAALFSMMNPIGAVAVFAGMTAHRPATESRRIAWTSAAAIAITLLIVTWTGSGSWPSSAPLSTPCAWPAG